MIRGRQKKRRIRVNNKGEERRGEVISTAAPPLTPLLAMGLLLR